MKVEFKNSGEKNDKAWFCKECKNMKRELKKCLREYRITSFDEKEREKFLRVKKRIQKPTEKEKERV